MQRIRMRAWSARARRAGLLGISVDAHLAGDWRQICRRSDRADPVHIASGISIRNSKGDEGAEIVIGRVYRLAQRTSIARAERRAIPVVAIIGLVNHKLLNFVGADIDV